MDGNGKGKWSHPDFEAEACLGFRRKELDFGDKLIRLEKGGMISFIIEKTQSPLADAVRRPGPGCVKLDRGIDRFGTTCSCSL